jgi:hypothetical protein
VDAAVLRERAADFVGGIAEVVSEAEVAGRQLGTSDPVTMRALPGPSVQRGFLF